MNNFSRFFSVDEWRSVFNSLPFSLPVVLIGSLIVIFYTDEKLKVIPNFSLWLAFLLIFLLVVGAISFALWRVIENPNQENGSYQEIARSLQTALAPVWLGVLIIFIAAIADGTPQNLVKLANHLAIGGASLASGSFLGVLFGLPRSSSSRNTTSSSSNSANSSQNNANESRPYYSDNTNIEEISDWLTKILVGVGLVQLTKIGKYIKILQEQLHDPTKYAIFEVSLVILFVIWGFFLGYLSARLFLPTAFSRSLNRQLREKDYELQAKDEALKDRQEELKFNIDDRNNQQNIVDNFFLNQIQDLINQYRNRLNDLDIDLLQKLNTGTDTELNAENFKRDSPYHEQLRKLREMSLIYPTEGGKWDAGKTICLTAFGKSFIPEQAP